MDENNPDVWVDRTVQIWIEFTFGYGCFFRGWSNHLFDNLEPGMIVRFDCNDNLIYRVLSYPFLSTKYSPNPNREVETIYNTEFLCYPENE